MSRYSDTSANLTSLQPVLVAISCIGWVTNHFTATKFVNQNDISAAVG